MPSSIISVDYKHMGREHGLTGGADENGPWVTRPFLVEWKDLGDFIYQVRGGTSYSGSFGGGIWKRNLPMQDFQIAEAYAMNVTWEPDGEMLLTDPISYSHAVVKVTFRRPPWSMQESADPGFANSIGDDSRLLYTSQEVDFGAKYYDIPASAVTWDTDGAKVNTPMPRKVSTIIWNITYHLFPYLPMGVFEEYVDSVNDAPIFGRARGTVMFTGPKTLMEVNADGSRTTKVQMVYNWRKIEWNKFLRPDTIRWDVPKDSTGARVYEYKDFNKLLDYFK